VGKSGARVKIRVRHSGRLIGILDVQHDPGPYAWLEVPRMQ